MTAKHVRLPLPASFIRCLAHDCDQGDACARHVTIRHDVFDGSSTVKPRLCTPEDRDFLLPLADPEAV